MLDLLPFEPRREPERSGRFRHGAHKPLAMGYIIIKAKGV